MTEFLLIGIDAGVDTGLAVWNATSQSWYEDLQTTSFWACIDHIKDLNSGPYRLAAYVEDPSKISGIYSRHRPDKKKLKKALRMAQNVGMNKREAQLMIAGLRHHGIPVVEIRPSSSKMKRETFENLTQYKGSTSQHARDAAMLVFGRNMNGKTYQRIIDNQPTEFKLYDL